MESCLLSGFARILSEALKIFLKNGKLMTVITLLTLFLYSILFLSNIFSINQLITDYVIKHSFILVTSSSRPEFADLLISMERDTTIFGWEWTLVLTSFIASSFLASVTIFASATLHCEKKLSIKNLLSSTMRSWKKPFVTLFYMTIFGVGYIYPVLEILLPSIVEPVFVSSALSFMILILATVFYAYVAAFWTLALVVSVLEEKYGIEALGRSAQIVKGMQLHGYLLNLLFMILFFILSRCLRLMRREQPAVIQLFIGLLVLNSICLVRMFMLMAYTVLYYHCKQTHGEEVELQ